MKFTSFNGQSDLNRIGKLDLNDPTHGRGLSMLGGLFYVDRCSDSVSKQSGC